MEKLLSCFRRGRGGKITLNQNIIIFVLALSRATNQEMI